MKKIAILGSTGSIGKSALEVVDHLGPEYTVSALAAHSNIDLIEAQAKKYRPEIVALYDETLAREKKDSLPGNILLSGMEGCSRRQPGLPFSFAYLIGHERHSRPHPHVGCPACRQRYRLGQ